MSGRDKGHHDNHHHHLHDHDHDHDHDHEFDDDDLVVLVDEEGHEHHFYLWRVVEVDGSRYALLAPEDDEEGNAFVFRWEEGEDGNDHFSEVEDEEEFARVEAALAAEEDES